MDLFEDIKEICEDRGVIFYDSENLKENDENIFRVYIHSKEGVTIDKCTEISRLLSPLFDVNPPLNGEYRLEVSSAGIERKLKEKNHFIYSVGELIEIVTTSNDRLNAKLIKADENSIILLMHDSEIEIEYSDIKKAKTYFKW